MTLSRRNFIKAALASSAITPALANAASSTLRFSTDALGKSIVDGPLGKALPEKAPALISDKNIYSTIEVDVLVAGCGLSGLCAAMAAAEQGAKVMIIEKGMTYGARGADNGGIDSKFQRDAGIVIDKDKVAHQLMQASGFRANQRLINLWIEHSGESLDWVIDMAIREKVMPSISLNHTVMNGNTPLFPTAVQFAGGNIPFVSALEHTARMRGISVLYQTPLVQLLRKGNGRVTGVIARDQQGRYLRINAKKAVIICTGGYENSQEMMQQYLRPDQYEGIRVWLQPTPSTTGDALRIASWVGAAPQAAPHCLMRGTGVLPDGQLFAFLTLPWLHVNVRGERFAMEQMPSDYMGNAINQQPGHAAFAIWDSRWQEVVRTPGQLDGLLRGAGSDETVKRMDEYVKLGLIIKAESLAELAKKMNVPAEKLLATVTRYSQLALQGYDHDFGKPANWMNEIVAPPFYAASSGLRAFVTLSGLSINDNLQVRDTQQNPIEGLYAAGNASGDLFFDTYPREVVGASHGRAITFGRLAGMNAMRKS